jgi:anaerobic dimethyl sulfoxide reductase subunit A
MSEKNAIFQALTETALTRRSFLKWSAALGGTAALAGGLKFGLKAVESAAQSEEGEWRTAICWHNCGGRCLLQAYVVDGTVVRCKTDDTHPDSPDFPQQRACPRGRANKWQTFGADRVKYPMKRKNWEPGGGKKEMRGRDEWVRITWEEALDIVASEIKRIIEKYGNEAIHAYGRGAGSITDVLSLAGGYVAAWGSTSFGTWPETGNAIGAFYSNRDIGVLNRERLDQNDRFDVRNSDLVVIWGQNCVWSGAGNPSYYYWAAKKAGAKFIVVDPLYTETAKILADDWIPVRPGTDHALILGMMHTLITEDDPAQKPLIDWDFLHRCTVGFDAEHMPEGADPKENFKDYVLGTYDGKPKTAEWAAEICGVPPEKIKSFAREVAQTRKTALHYGYAPSRTNNSDSLPQVMMTLGWMCGHVGESGRSTGCSCRYNSCYGGHELVTQGSGGMSSQSNPISKVRLNNNELWNAVLNGKYTDGLDSVKDINIQAIIHGGSSALNQKVDAFKGVEAHRKVEFVCTMQYFLNTNARYSDVVLPVTTRWERFADFGDGANRKREIIVMGRQITEPMFEAKDDTWIAMEIGKRLGFDPEAVCPLSEKQVVFNTIATTKVIKKDGSGMETLVKITDKDLQEWGVEGEPQEGRISLNDFYMAGFYQVERYQGDPYGYIAHKAYREDPEANPQPTASGKFEIHSQTLADKIASFGWTTVDPIPTYNPPIEGYEDTFEDWEQKVKGEYPLQLYTIHYLRRGHSNFDNVQWLREAFPQEVIMNTVDAGERGIAQGDTILVRSPHGQVMRPVVVTERMMPGVVTLGQGAWIEMDELTGVDKAGNTNILNGGNPTGQGHAGFNTCIVQIEKWSGEPLMPDVRWPQRIVF